MTTILPFRGTDNFVNSSLSISKQPNAFVRKQPPQQDLFFGQNGSVKRPAPKSRAKKAAWIGLLAMMGGLAGPILAQAKSQAVALSQTVPAVTAPLTSPAQRVHNVLEWVKKAWEGKDYKDKGWNDIRAGLRISDDTKLMEISPYRLDILKNGPSQPDIPSEVILEAIYSAGVLGQTAKDSALSADLAKHLTPYTERVIVEVMKDDGTKVRYFVAPDRAKEGPNTEVYDFRDAAKSALAKSVDAQTLNNIAEAMLGAGNDLDKVQSFFSIILQADPSVQLSDGVEAKAEAWVYESSEAKEDPLDNIRKLLKQIQTTDGDKPTPELAVEKTDKSLLSEELTKRKLVSREDQNNRMLAAMGIKFLTTRNPQDVLQTLPAIAQWFTDPDEALTMTPSDDNLMVLESLARHAQHDQAAFEILTKVVASFPEFTGRAFFNGNNSTEFGQLRDTARELTKAFKAHPKETHALVMALVNRDTSMLWPEPASKDKDDVETYQKVRDMGRKVGFAIMLTDQSGIFSSYLRSVAQNRFAEERHDAMEALAYLHDKDSVNMLLEIGANNLEDDATRALGIQAALYILTGPRLAPQIQDRAEGESPFNTLRANSFLKKDKKGNYDFTQNTNPFEQQIGAKFSKWLAQQEQLRADAKKSGHPAAPVSDVAKLMKMQELVEETLSGGDKQFLVTQGKDPAFQAAVLDPMIEYLKGDNLNLSIAVPMMKTLAAAQYEPAAAVIADIAKHPDKHTEISFGFFGVFISSQTLGLLKAYALKSLGGTATPTGEHATMIQNVLRDPFTPFQVAGLEAMEAMGEKISSALDSATPEQAVSLTAARDAHVATLMDFIRRSDRGYLEQTQPRIRQDMYRYMAARALDKLGGIDVMMKLVQEEAAKNENSPFVRSLVSAMLTNGRTVEAVRAAGYDTVQFDRIANKKYWLEDMHAQGHTGQGGEHAHFDVGHVNPIGKLTDLVQYPAWTKFSDEENWGEPHPTGTAETYRTTAPGISKIYSYSVAEAIPTDPAQPTSSRDALVLGLEDLIQKQLTGETNVQTTNHSYGYANFALYSEDMREHVLDLASAYLELLGETGVTNFVSAGNSQGEGIMSQYDPVGTQNTLGSRTDKDGNVKKSDSTVLVAAADGLLKWLAEFSSMPNPLRLDEALEMFNAPGSPSLTLYKENNEWKVIPVHGTSFSSPNLAGLTMVAKRARANAGLPEWTEQELVQALRNASAPLPGREAWESGRYVEPLKFLLEALKPVEAPVATAAQ